MRQRKLLISITLFSVIAVCQFPVMAADAEAGKQISQSKGCVGCHGANGISAEGTSYPNLAGQKEAYIVKALNAYKEIGRTQL